jgi:hypothetical protein
VADDKGVKRIAILLIVLLVLPGCSGRDADDSPAAPPLTEADVLAAVPVGVSLSDWAISADGEYMYLATETLNAPENVSPRSASVYRATPSGPAEVARVGAAGREPLIRTRETLLPSDEGGHRRLELQEVSTRSAYAVISIDADDEVTVVHFGKVDPQSNTVRSARTSDAIRPTAAPTPSPARWSPTASVGDVPAGAVPAGWGVTDVAWSPDGRHVAIATTSNASYLDSQLSVYSVDGDVLRERWRTQNVAVRIDEELRFVDVNGDATLDIVYTSSFGNGWLWSPTLAVSIESDGSPVDVPFEMPIERSSPSSPEDLNGDGVYEWWSVDASWELEGFCHACSPSSLFVLAWDGAQYVDATPRFAPDLFERRQSTPVRQELPETCEAQDGYLSELISLFLTAYNADSGVDYAPILSQLRELDVDPRLRAKRDQIVETLERDPHAPHDIEWWPCGVPDGARTP